MSTRHRHPPQPAPSLATGTALLLLSSIGVPCLLSVLCWLGAI
jgi:hypothetical protein